MIVVSLWLMQEIYGSGVTCGKCGDKSLEEYGAGCFLKRN